MEARVTAQSQTFRLVERMQEAKVLHGQEVRADLTNVRILAFAESNAEAQVRFCEMGPIRVREILTTGDDRPLPAEVSVDGLDVRASGMFDILNARLSSNGAIRVVVDEQASIHEALVPHRHAPPLASANWPRWTPA
jgi:hypothetical protein